MASPNKKKKPAAARQAPKSAVPAPRPAPDVQAGMDVFDKIVWYCLHALVILVPIAMSNLTFLKIGNGLPLTYDQFDIAKVFVMRAFMLVALAAWAWKMLMVGGRLRRTKADWFIVAFLGWVTVTTFTSISPATAFWGKYRRFEGLASFITYAVVFFLVVQLVDRPSRIRSLARSLFIGGVLVALYGVMQALGLDMIQWGQLPFEVNRSFATFGNPDLLGGYLMFPLPIAIGLWLTEDNPVWRFVYGFGFVFVFLCWITAFVRGAWIGGAVSMLFLMVAAIVLSRRKELVLHWVDAAVVGVMGMGAAAFVAKSLRSTNVVMNIGTRLVSIFQFGEGSAKTRFEIWEAAWNAVKARPILGFGADTFRLVFPKYKPMAYAKDAGYLSVADNVHDYPLQLASGVGIPGLLLLYVGVFGVVLVVSMIDIVKRVTGPTRYLLLSFWAACLGYIVHLFFGLSVTGSTVMLWFCFGILLSTSATSRDVEAPAWGTIASVVAIAALAGLFVYNVVFMAADNHYLQARIAGQYDPALHLREAKAAVSLNPYNDMYRAEVGLAYQDQFFSALQQSFSAQGQQRTDLLQQATASFKDAEASLKDTIAFVPTEYDNYVFLADLYNRAGTYLGDPAYFNNAVQISEKAIKDVEPYGPAIRLQAAQAYAGLRDSTKALELLDSAVKMDPAYADAYLLKGQILQNIGRLPEAKAALTLAVQNAGNGNIKQAAQQVLTAVEASLTSGTKK